MLFVATEKGVSSKMQWFCIPSLLSNPLGTKENQDAEECV